MRISHQYKFIFFANPKTGSSTVRQFLDPYSDVRAVKIYRYITPENPFYPHMMPKETKVLFQQFGWDFKGYTKFVFTRNPWARLVSLYEHLKREEDTLPPFSDWLYSIKPYGVGGGGKEWERYRRYGTYSIEHYIKDDEGNILVDKVIRLEDINEQLFPFLSALNIPISMSQTVPHKNNRGVGVRYPEYFTAQMTEYVRHLYHYDIVNYGYTFET